MVSRGLLQEWNDPRVQGFTYAGDKELLKQCVLQMVVDTYLSTTVANFKLNRYIHRH